ncbi:Helix-turn-helix domain-containing protein [Paraburkholderia susongensis]|uniref:Helix-turn-helix domain-containing protein n=1 Tax=Paraburkholderia susongensis TaxID=1515439 RepID=A0A1X7JJ51_9BURK|nr:Helix-turn-helix domain-containing protein [Paraburkholderia susongensis]
MSTVATRAASRYSLDAVRLLGQLIRRARLERKITASQLAERAGLSRSLVQRIEKGDPRCSIGAVFEAAAVVGVRLFDADSSGISAALRANAEVLTLLPRAVRAPRIETRDDF